MYYYYVLCVCFMCSTYVLNSKHTGKCWNNFVSIFFQLGSNLFISSPIYNGNIFFLIVWTEKGVDSIEFQASAAWHCSVHDLSQFSGHTHGPYLAVPSDEHLSY